MSRTVEETNRRMLRARDAMDRAYAQPLDVPALARIAHVSPAHFARTFRATFGETPHRYLQRRRVERAMYLLRETDRSVTDICFEVGFGSPGTFSRTFRDIVGRPPRAYRKVAAAADVPTCARRRGRGRCSERRPCPAVRSVRPRTEQFWISFRPPRPVA